MGSRQFKKNCNVKRWRWRGRAGLSICLEGFWKEGWGEWPVVKKRQEDLSPAHGHPQPLLGLSGGLTLRGRRPSAKPDSNGERLLAQCHSEGEFIVFHF